MAEVLVVGSGLAGVRMCEQLRAAGFRGGITVLGAEAVAPYDRPPLTKTPDADVDLRSAMGIDVFALADEVRLGVAATSLGEGSDASLTVRTGAGVLRADAVVVATGAVPLLPNSWSAAGVLALRTRADAHHIWDHVERGSDLLVIGGGWIGCEVAATANARGAQVHLVESAAQVLADLPPVAARRIGDWLVDVGVEVRLGTSVVGVESASAGQAATLRDADGQVVALTAGLAVAGLGVRPATDWLQGCGVALAASGAALTDPWGRCSVPGVFAVGDVAARWSPLVGRVIPSGHWTEAMQAPVAVAPAVLDYLAGHGRGLDRQERWTQRPGVPAWDAIPYTFSELAEKRLLVLGDAAARSASPGSRREHIWRESAQGWTCFTVVEGRLVGLCGTRPRDIVGARRAMLNDPQGEPVVDAGALSDPLAAPALMYQSVG